MSGYILNSRYLAKSLNEETFDDIAKRVSKSINSHSSDEIYKLMIEKKFCPGGRTLAYAGVPNRKLTPNCVVLPFEKNTVKNIVDTLIRACILQRAGAGNGFNGNIINFNPNIKHNKFCKFEVVLNAFHEDIYTFIKTKFNILKKYILLDDEFLYCLHNMPKMRITCRNIHYNEKFIISNQNNVDELFDITIKDLYYLIKSSDCKIIYNNKYNNYIKIKDDFTDIMEKMRLSSDLCDNNISHILDFSNLRSCWSDVKSTDTKSSGPVAFIYAYDTLLNTINHIDSSTIITWLYVFSILFGIIQQKGRTGAQIMVLSIEHPDILNFIHVKDNLKIINNFNISVLFSKEYMELLESNPKMIIKNDIILRDYDKHFFVKDSNPITLTYSELWDEFIQSAYMTGEPGALFEDNMNKNNFLEPYLGRINACNPCSEISMFYNECCNLGSINIVKYAHKSEINPSTLDEILTLFDIDDFKYTVQAGIEFLNSVIDKLDISDNDLMRNVKLLRRVGLGIMGWADCLLKLRIPYNSKLALKFAKFISKTMYEQASIKSFELSKTYGSLKERLNISNSDDLLLNRCNTALLCCAPTGSTSILFDYTSYSIEPIYSMIYKRNYTTSFVHSDIVVNKYFKEFLEDKDLWNNRNLKELCEKGLFGELYNSNNEIIKISDYDKELFKSANDLKPIDHVNMQSAFQKYFDNSISKTVNFPEDGDIKNISDIFKIAHKKGIKGMTIYRDNCRKSVLNTVKSSDILNIYCKSGTCDL